MFTWPKLFVILGVRRCCQSRTLKIPFSDWKDMPKIPHFAHIFAKGRLWSWIRSYFIDKPIVFSTFTRNTSNKYIRANSFAIFEAQSTLQWFCPHYKKCAWLKRRYFLISASFSLISEQTIKGRCGWWNLHYMQSHVIFKERQFWLTAHV